MSLYTFFESLHLSRQHSIRCYHSLLGVDTVSEQLTQKPTWWGWKHLFGEIRSAIGAEDHMVSKGTKMLRVGWLVGCLDGRSVSRMHHFHWIALAGFPRGIASLVRCRNVCKTCLEWMKKGIVSPKSERLNPAEGDLCGVVGVKLLRICNDGTARWVERCRIPAQHAQHTIRISCRVPGEADGLPN